MWLSSLKNKNKELIFLPPHHLPMKTLWCKNQENPSNRISHTWAPLTLSLTGSWPPLISLLEACSGPLKRATLAEKRLFWWRHCRSYKASGSEERAISTNFPPFPLNRVHRSLGTSTGGLFRPTGKGEGTTIGGGGERIGSPKNFT